MFLNPLNKFVLNSGQPVYLPVVPELFYKAHSSHIHLCALIVPIATEAQVKCSIYYNYQVENEKFIHSTNMAPCGTNLAPIGILLFNIQIYLMHTNSVPRIVF